MVEALKTVIKAAIGGALAIGVWAYAIPGLGHLVPDRWWLDVRDVRVTSGNLGVAIDRDIKHLWFDPTKWIDAEGGDCPEDQRAGCREVRYWIGDVDVNIRRILGDGDIPSNCPGERDGLTYISGMPYPAAGRNLNWFLDSPPNAGCELGDGGYAADFTWTRHWLGIKLQAHATSNTFFVGEIPSGTAP